MKKFDTFITTNIVTRTFSNSEHNFHLEEKSHFLLYTDIPFTISLYIIDYIKYIKIEQKSKRRWPDYYKEDKGYLKTIMKFDTFIK